VRSAPRRALPPWVDREEYPFAPLRFETGRGEMSYLDEGSGPALLMLHGNPTWSFEYRHLVKALRGSYRCLAPDLLGFGLSDKPRGAGYSARFHAECLDRLVQWLGLRELALIGGDWGGPLGLWLAVQRPLHLRAAVLCNTFAWPVGRLDLYYQGFSRIMGGPLGRYLIRRHNVFVERVLPAATGRKHALTPAVLGHYRGPLAEPADREACWSFPGQIVGAADWLGEVWSRRELFRHQPFLVLWGDRDIAFRARELERWRRELTRAEIHRFADVGHSIPEEAHREAVPLIRGFLDAALGAGAAPGLARRA
jgi:haloalkane dehalogenase